MAALPTKFHHSYTAPKEECVARSPVGIRRRLGVNAVLGVLAIASVVMIGGPARPAGAAGLETSPVPARMATPYVPEAKPAVAVAQRGPGLLPPATAGWSARPLAGSIAVRANADPDSPVVGVFDKVNTYGDPQTFAVQAELWDLDGRPWLRIQLPTRPNGSEGYVPAESVSIEAHDEKFVVMRSTGILQRFQSGQLTGQWLVTVGTDSRPTPLGTFFVWTIWNRPTSAYGAGVLALNGHSEVLGPHNWPGEARLAIHGNARPTQLGGPGSSGCPRMLDSDIAPLLGEVRLGTPVEIVA